ncbi:MAG: hypothetical protein ACI94Y_003536, partial [Maribacter sp.]
FTPKLEINTQSGTAFFYPNEINYIEASPCIIHTIYGQSIQTTENFNSLANRILTRNDRTFYKTRSYLYNLNQIIHVYSKRDESQNYKDFTELKNQQSIPIPKGVHKRNIIEKISVENN